MKNLIIRCFFGILLTSLSACSSDTAPRFSILQGLRVIDLILDQPEINFDGTNFTPNSVQLTPWVSDLYGSGRTLLQSVSWCLDPGIGAGATPTCSGNPTQTNILTDQVVAASASFLAPNYVGAVTPISIPLSGFSSTVQTALSAFYASESSAQRYNGYSILIFYEVYPQGRTDLKVTTFKRLIFSDASKASKNQNPSGLEVRASGVEITSLPTVNTDLQAYLPNTSSENYLSFASNGSSTSMSEVLNTSWYLTGPEDVKCSKKSDCTSDGLLAIQITGPSDTNAFTPPTAAQPTTRGRILVAVSQDGRGGSVAKRYCDGICP